MAIEKHVLKVSTTGGDGSATGSSILALPLVELLAIHLDFNASAPATTDTTVTASGNPLAVTLLTVTDSVTDAWFYPKVQDDDNSGSAITGSYSHPIIQEHLTIDLAQCNALTDAVVATIYVRI